MYLHIDCRSGKGPSDGAELDRDVEVLDSGSTSSFWRKGGRYQIFDLWRLQVQQSPLEDAALPNKVFGVLMYPCNPLNENTDLLDTCLICSIQTSGLKVSTPLKPESVGVLALSLCACVGCSRREYGSHPFSDSGPFSFFLSFFSFFFLGIGFSRETDIFPKGTLNSSPTPVLTGFARSSVSKTNQSPCHEDRFDIRHLATRRSLR